MIRGERVVLRPVEERDYPLIHVWQNQPEVWFWMDYERPFSLEDIAEGEARARAEGHPFVIETDGRPIGRIGLNRFRARDRICSLCVYIGEPTAVRESYRRDAITTLLAYAFDRLDLHMIELWCLAADEPAVESYRGCGFVEDGTLRDRSFKDGRWHDRVVMSITREEFTSLRQAGDPGDR